MPEPREAVRKMAPYSPPTGGRAGKLRFDFNENTVGCSPKVIECLRQYMTADALSMYPEYSKAIETLARCFEVAPDEFTMTNGTDEGIQVLVNTFVNAGDEVLLMKPSYAMYRFYAELAGASIREVDYNADDLSFPVEEFLAAIRPSTRAILIANPNNPTGTAIDRKEIRDILAAAPQAAVLIDEAYFDYWGVTVLGRFEEFPNLFVSRTFSKAYGMAALRCGCLFSCAENVAWLRKAQSPYSVNMLAAVAASVAVEDQYRLDYVREVVQARVLAWDGLRRLGIGCYPTVANFILFDAGERAIEIRDALRARGVLVRDRSYEIPGGVRVTIGTRAQVERFLTELEDIWKR